MVEGGQKYCILFYSEENLNQDEINKLEKYVKWQVSLLENPNSKWKPSFAIGRLEKDKIGIEPDYTITKYQESNFQNEKIIDFVHLDAEKEEMIKLAEWKELEKAYLK